MKFKTLTGPYLRENQKASVIMNHLMLALIPIIIFTTYKNGYLPYREGYYDFIMIFYPLFFIAIAAITCVITETLFFWLRKENVWETLKKSHAIFPGLFVALVLPINTPIYILIIGCLVATIVGKLIFGGFGYNIFNPALLGVLFVMSIYGATIMDSGGYLNPYEADTISQATPLSTEVEGIGGYSSLVEPYGQLSDFFIGTIPGTVGETSALLIILAFFYLAINRMIKWRITTTYVATVFIMTYLIGSLNDFGAWYPLFHIFSGGLLFGAVFMATDPVTSPTTPVGQLLFGLFLGILTVILRFLSPYPEGVLTAILTMNLLVFILDKIGRRARFNFAHSAFGFIIAWILIVSVSLLVASGFDRDSKDDDFVINEIKEEDNQVIYNVSQRGFSGWIEAEVILENGAIVDFIIIAQTESYWQRIENADYITQLLEADDFTEVDAVSSATITCDSLQAILQNVQEDYHE